ncbi:ABC transporter ATP-binding protein [Peribacillus psychrosaccharolyticus]|uniref:ABC transporter ATP-binding protein n=1 Tax=Peribacillus psychrosaccharolyticus TaxID=1407 RepID=A0A974NR15_PERPY|nr:ABC transporter ATP-binding protein [Peribacillus psychrosaccharolyticus]MEC2057728.1 ABC transporter ATP-binding protein [Peribacillus psychrosaccharolyticus]MED3744742.1 ABC transporter ATP-binding protein [Peribacillus psychrosaccharolyticus]QQT02257.1 ABC transporter ATP-binding protein [Peribacillus psychrosaccharolyticus]
MSEVKVEPKANWRSFFVLLKSEKLPIGMIVFVIGLSLLETGAALIVPLFTKGLVDQMSGSGIETGVIILLLAAFIIQTAAGGFSFYFLMYIGENLVAGIRRKLWDHVLRLPVSFFDANQSGETLSRITQDTNTIKTVITNHLVTFISGIVSIIGSIIILFMLDWRMTSIMLGIIPISLLILMPLGRKMYKVSRSTQDEMASFSGNLGRVLSEIRLVKSYNGEALEKEKGFSGVGQLFHFGLKEARIQAVISPFMTTIMMMILVILIGYGGIRVASGALTAGTLVAIIIYMFQIVVPFSQMASFFTAFQKALGATDRIQHLLNLEQESYAGNEGVMHGDLTFDQVVFSYEHSKPILTSVSFTVPATSTIALVGPSGGGKTTIFSLIERFYQPDSGNVTIGGVKISDFDLSLWRSQIGYVSQDSPVMTGTVRDNICYGVGRDITDEEVRNAASMANADRFIEKLPNSYDTEVGERGVMLSGGQRQRIAIARAILRDPRILLLDEATSNLDSESEQLVQYAIKNLMKGRTTLIIAHRLSTVIEADQLLVLEEGRITGRGTHRQLLESHDLYKKLASQQLQLDLASVEE